jgi:hypothetical protein
MKVAAVGISARHNHLIRAAQCAGEAFAHTSQEERRRTRSGQSFIVWLGIASLAAMALFVAF